MTNIGAKFSLIETAPTQKPVHLLISITVRILDEGILDEVFFYGH